MSSCLRMEVIRFKSVGDMSDVHRSRYHLSPIESREMDADVGHLEQHKGRDHGPGKWASCKLLGFRPNSDRCDDGEQEEEARRRFKSTGDFLAEQCESCPTEEDAGWKLMLAPLAGKASREVLRGDKHDEEEETSRGPATTLVRRRASGTKRRKVAAKLARLALSSPALAASQQRAKRQQQVEATRLLLRDSDTLTNGQQRRQQQQQRVENNGQLGGAGPMTVVADQEGPTRSSQPMETGHLGLAATNDSQQKQLRVTGDAQHNAASERQQQAGDNGNDFAFASVVSDRDSASDRPQVTGRGVGFASAAVALPQSQAQVRLGTGAAGRAWIGENANACAPSPGTTTLKATGNILPNSHLAGQQQQQSSAAAAAGAAGVDYGGGEAKAQSKQQVSHAHLNHEHRQHHSSCGSRRQERECEQRSVVGGGGEGEGEAMGERNLAAAAADSGRIVVEMVGQHWLDDALVGHQQPAASRVGEYGLVANNASAGKLAELNFSAAANRLVGSLCCAGHTWRQALQPPSHSGTYKVAQREQQQAMSLAISGNELQVGGDRKQEIKFAGTMAGQQQQQATATTGRHVRRHPRPGRSPISLQRQTNARLAKHRAKIQQQRQEQLALLALSERQQLGGHQVSGGQEQEGGMPDTKNQQHSNIYIINDRLTSCRQQQRSSSSKPSTSAQAFEQRRQQQPQVISPTTSTAIEICDNQLACTSSGSSGRGLQSYRDFNLSRPPASTARTSLDNVFVYKSINMFRNSQSANESTKGVDKNLDDTLTISSSGSTLSLGRPFCKICHMGSSRAGDKLISPCKCSGTMQYIHCGCLLKWLEISNRTNEKPMSCELCAHEYSWHKMFNYKHLRWPKCSLKDIILHIVFVLALVVMMYSAIAPILQRKSQDNIAPSLTPPATKLSSSANSGRERQQLVGSQFYHASLGGRSNHLASSSLASDEKQMLLCAASFFISFFLAIYVQTKARDTLYGVFVKFLNLNQTYYITEYDHGNSTASKQLLQQQQQHAASCPRNYRKSGQEELINS